MKDKLDESEDIGVEVVMDNKEAPMVLWYPESKELEVRILDMLAAAGYEPLDDEKFEALKNRVHERIKQAFESEEIRTLMQARLMSFDLILKAAKKGEVVGAGPGSMKDLLEKQVLLN